MAITSSLPPAIKVLAREDQRRLMRRFERPFHADIGCGSEIGLVLRALVLLRFVGGTQRLVFGCDGGSSARAQGLIAFFALRAAASAAWNFFASASAGCFFSSALIFAMAISWP
jgi:hypothetical protein